MNRGGYKKLDLKALHKNKAITKDGRFFGYKIYRRCHWCKKSKKWTLDFFYSQSNITARISYTCKQCVKKYEQSKSNELNKRKYAWASRNKEKIRAHEILRSALNKKILVKKPCNVCGSKKVHGHHHDYKKPLDVIWLCPKHHRQIHEKQ